MRSGQRGQATIELALCLPVFALLAAILVEVGSLATDQVRVWHAAREAARVAAVEVDDAAIRAAATRSGLRDLTVEVDPESEGRVQGEPVTVRVVYRSSPRVPVVGSLFSGLVLEATATMRIEQP